MKINKLLQVLSGLPLITAAGVGALFSATACSNQLTIKTLYTQFVKNNFYRFDGTPYETHACDWLYNKIKSFHYKDKTRPVLPIDGIAGAHDLDEGGILKQNYSTYSISMGTWEGSNLLLTIPTNQIDAKSLVITAHYDTKNLGIYGPTPNPSDNTQGAIDDGSGIALLLYWAHYYSIHQNTSAYNIQLLFCGDEESGLLGSSAFAKAFFGDPGRNGVAESPKTNTFTTNYGEIKNIGVDMLNKISQCITVDCPTGGDYMVIASPTSAFDGVSTAQPLMNDHGDPVSLSDDQDTCNISQKLVDKLTDLSKTMYNEAPYYFTKAPHITDIVDPKVMSPLNLGEAIYDESDYFAFYRLGIECAAICAANPYIKNEKHGVYFAGTTNPKCWSTGIKTVVRDGITTYEAGDHSKETQWGDFMHTKYDRLDYLLSIFGKQFYKQMESTWKILQTWINIK